MALKYISRIYFQGKLVAYFKRNGGTMRFKLCKIEKNYLDKKLRVKDTYKAQNYETLNVQIDELEAKIDNAVSALLFDNPKAVINNKIIDEYFLKVKEQEEKGCNPEAEGSLLYDFRTFNKTKEDEKHQEDIDNGENRNLHPTMKDYISAANAIEDYEYDTQMQYHLSDITEDFIDDFKDWLADEHVNTSEHKYRCKGGMVNKTINKRLENLSAFVRNFYKDNVTADMIMECRLEASEKKKVIALTFEEVKDLYMRKLKNSNHNKVRDYFVFLCLTGLRYLDLTLLSETNFLKQRDGTYKLSYVSHKTKVEVELDLTSKAQLLAKKYDFRFRDYTNQGFNRALGEMLENEHLYEDEIAVIRKVLKKNIQTKMCRREKISAHTARRTFISCLIAQGVPPFQVMNMSGHKRFSTMEVYVRWFSKDITEAMRKLEF